MGRSLWALLTGALGAAALWLAFRPSDEVKAATGNGDASAVLDPASNVKAPNVAPAEAGRWNWRFFVPTLQGGENISETVRGRIDARVTALEPTITSAADRFSVPTDLLAVVLHRESGGNPNATGDGGASVGLGQIKEATQNTVNRYWGTDLDRTNWVHNIYLTAGNLRRLYEEMYAGGWGLGRDLSTQWYEAVRGHLCGKEGAEEDSSCGSQEASHRLATAGLSNQIPT
jgi:soluble lytic murein transglycosylase-like protein